jgi:hypothetical protein
MRQIVVSSDGAVSGQRAACAAVVTIGGRVLAQGSRSIAHGQGYTLGAEIAGVALGARLAEALLVEDQPVIFEVDNPSVPAVIAGRYQPPGFRRIPAAALAAARDFCIRYPVTMHVRPRKSTPGLALADQLGGQRLWGRRRARRRR